MSFDPDVVRLFAQLQQSGQPAMDTLPIEGARAMMRALGAQLGFPRVEMAQVRDLHADTATGPVRLRLYRPSELAPGPAPTCLFVHGGGGVVGDLDSHDDVCRQLAARAGCQLLAVDYRLAPEHPAPAGVEDVIATLQWLVAQPHVVGADVQRLAIAGDSIGGAMAAVAALAARDAGIALRCQVLVYPLTDAREDTGVYPSRSHNAGLPPLTAEAVRFFNRHLLPDPAIAQDWRVSPMLVPDVAGVAPALVVVGDRDMLCDEGRAYAERLRAAGVEVTLHSFPGMIHGFINMGGVLRAADETLALAALVLRQRLLPAIGRWASD
ncbi:alpha/beta hydrolase [Xanthomonas hortorum]|uniref:Carboxylesterase NlhH n=1 Tax=Xanthomonas hortorum pv. gardneri TaxID=2754056 RepID=A0A6V7BMM7_9XANT|nr:alpha/beta hydrolase [Xanthomonas hortorum]MCC4624505.1 alpha/beta hydrolase [Xanthomonas campestris pv. nigromaculans]APP78360.1 lipase [Xanthomonas hortorum pv. gardneri]EGD17691.1 esterase/lipase [Xanthomonas hortorum ATCC 19865]KLA96042.1 lipase [Xanthomonas hortorum pv. gardneri]KLA97026.1 lipase [Xanthomonas hortorum pv. gardneri]